MSAEAFDVESAIARTRAAAEEDRQDEFMAATIKSGGQAQETGVSRWFMNLPKNVTVGVIDAAKNTFDAVADFGAAAVEEKKESLMSGVHAYNRNTTGDPQGRTAAQIREERSGLVDQAPSVYGQASEAVMNFRDELARGGSTADAVTQGVAQFVVPFMGWSKAIGGIRGATKLGTAARALTAESAAVGTAFAPDAARAADLIQMGREVEGKFGDAMRAVTPDGSLQNAYINYMLDREDEGAAEGRFKNVVDSLGLSAATAGVIKVGATGLKVGRKLPQYIAENAGTSRVGLRGQQGHIVFHGTPHDFDFFDSTKIGSGEGNQSFGHGLYFAENEKIAQNYATKLSRWEPGEVARAKRFLQQLDKKNPNEAYGFSDPRDYVVAAQEKGFVPKTSAKLLEVHIPDEKVAQMLDYDAEMSKQADVIAKIPTKDLEKFDEMLADNDQAELADLTGNHFYQLVGRAISEDYIDFTPRDGNFDNLKRLAAEYLQSQGIPGIRYLDGSSRRTGDGSRNLVLFDANDATITKKNGKRTDPKKSPPKLELKEGANGLDLYVNGKPFQHYTSFEQAQEAVSEFGFSLDKPSDDVLARVKEKVTRKAHAANLPALAE